MPRYDYKCPKGHVTEALLPMSADKILCPDCGLPAKRVPINTVYIQGETVAKS